METFLSLVKMIGFLLLILYLINISLKYLNRYTNQHNHQLRILQKSPSANRLRSGSSKSWTNVMS